MRILLITQYFPPETGATSNRLLSLARGMQAAGHEVVVVAEKPNHPEGVIWEEYRGHVFTERTYEGIPVIYTWVFARPQKTFATRLAFYLSYMVMAIGGALRARGSFDVVLASSPPLFVGIAGWVAARLKGAKFVFDVRDLWPDVAVAMGMLTAPAAIKAAERLERFLYRRADGLTAVTRSFCRHLRKLANPGTPVQLVMNGTVPEQFEQDTEKELLREKAGVDEQFVVTYAGNLGAAQGLGHVLDAAENLVSRRPQVTFLMVGGGPEKQRLKEEATRRGLANIRFIARVPLHQAVEYMAASDALLVSLADHPIYQQFIPSKLFDGMASGQPILLSVEGEARTILDAAEGGIAYPAEDGAALAEAVEWLMDHPDAAEAMGTRGHAYVRKHGTRAVQAQRMVTFLETLHGEENRTSGGPAEN